MHGGMLSADCAGTEQSGKEEGIPSGFGKHGFRSAGSGGDGCFDRDAIPAGFADLRNKYGTDLVSW